jgi:ABC-2 type transport system permease protein
VVLTIASKELKALFASPLAWLVLTIVQLIAGYSFLRRLDDFLQVQPQLVQAASAAGVTELVAAPVFATAALILLFSTPLLGMRSIAEERRNQTFVFLTSAPLSMTQIAIGKFLGIWIFLALIIALVAVMPLSLAASTSLDYGLMASVCCGLILLSAGFAAISLYISSLTVQPVAAAFGTFAAIASMILVSETAGDGLRARGWHLPAALVQVLSPLRNFEPFGKGMIDTYAIVCSLLLVLVFIVMTVRRLEARLLRG